MGNRRLRKRDVDDWGLHQPGEDLARIFRMDNDAFATVDRGTSHVKAQNVGAFPDRSYLAGKVSLATSIPEAMEHVLFDPQTSGGLLFAVAPDDAGRVESLFAVAEEPIWRVGDVAEGESVEVVAYGRPFRSQR